jgi:succinyl-CoA synthetase alpha subunit
MSILLDTSARVVVQGITGKMATWVVEDLTAYGTNVVAGVVPGRGGRVHAGRPVFDSVAEAVAETGADTSLIFVPPMGAREATMEAVEAGIALTVYPGDGLPILDAVNLRRAVGRRPGQALVGPNSPGLISPGRSKVGFMPSQCFTPGRLGVISRSGSLSYEVCWRLTSAGIGQSTVVGIGGDPVKGLTIPECLSLFHEDDETDAILLLGEVGGTEEYTLVDYVTTVSDAKPVAAFMVGRMAPPGKKMGHAGALIGGPRESYAAKRDGLRASGIPFAGSLNELVPTVQSLLGSAV